MTKITTPVRRDVDGMAGIGRTLFDLRGVRFGEGDGGNTPAAPAATFTPPAVPAAPAAPAATPAAPAAPAPVPTPPPAPAPVEVKVFDQEYVTSLREEAKANRIAREKAEAELASTKTAIAEYEAKAAEAKLTSAVTTAANLDDVKANAALLLDSSGFQKTLAEVNLDDADAVKAAVVDWTGKNPAYKTGPTPPSRSGPGHIGTGDPGSRTNTLQGAVTAALSAQS